MNLSTITFSIYLTAVVAEDGSSFLKGAVSSSSITAIDANSSNGAMPNLRSEAIYCDSDAECRYNQFCRMPDGQCFYNADTIDEDAEPGVHLDTSPPAEGQCKRKPDISACYVGSEVCGCNGKTYDCRQEAYRNGMNVDYEGPCDNQRWGTTGAIVNAGSPAHRALDIYSGRCKKGANIQLFHQTGGDNQQWIYHHESGVIESVACPGMVLNIDGGVNSNCAPGTNIILWDESGVDWEKWMYSPDKKIISQYCKNMVIDIADANDADEANIQLWTDGGSNAWNQKWSLGK